MNDTDRYPLFVYHPVLKEIIPTKEKFKMPFWQYHHFVEKKFLKRHPEREEELLKHQKLIYMPMDMNYDIDNRTAGFKKRWEVELSEVVYLDDWRLYTRIKQNFFRRRKNC